MMKSKIIHLNKRASKKNVSLYSKHHALAKVLFGAAHWVVAHEASLWSSGATIDFHRAKLGTLEDTVYTPFSDATLNVTIDRISSTEFARRLNCALHGSSRVVADKSGAPDPMET